ncbi:hypothetical protein VCRA2116O30_20219 [Vibrio crassostreae]|nr:hypothetical protein VCRA2118O41_120101 [Vibrio crassostreae]CAK2012908.1 hypothetical protein VCRA2116O30_20219 [Vibrio crassostreae]CAK2078188.1 hypothetical protein VCRA2113O20_30098 [Vibrio crassostreae]CAK2083768.1 hypothetical protein VCRA2119O45_30219 [Vibrio crassostreae]CAK2123582.1 hypothetical protein VCRA2117O38_40028 [Vibrio crassostreae]
MTSKRCPKGSAKSVLLFVEGDLLRMLGYFPLAAIKTLLSRTKFNHERSTRPNDHTALSHQFTISYH